MDSNPYYIEKLAGFKKRFNNAVLEPLIFQPTPSGVEHLCAHYSKKYPIDLRCYNLTYLHDHPENLYHSFSCLKESNLLELEEESERGLVFSHGQFHAIAVYICNVSTKKSMIVFYSSAGGREAGYFKIAKLFPEYDFYVNEGSRQSDEGSCITDSICILKEALQVNDLVSLVSHTRKESAYCINYKPFIFKERQPDNLHVFKMPEQLLLTAQRSDFVRACNADLGVEIRGGQTLGHYRSQFAMNVSFFNSNQLSSPPSDEKSINSYLFVKSSEHKNILDNIYREECLNDLIEMNIECPLDGDEERIQALQCLSPNSEARKAYRMLNNASV